MQFREDNGARCGHRQTRSSGGDGTYGDETFSVALEYLHSTMTLRRAHGAVNADVSDARINERLRDNVHNDDVMCEDYEFPI